ncbi:MAG: cysteine desulfurase [Chlamydiales bacterium]|jgi:cysteine desulfurase
MTERTRVYLDHNATTPMRPEAWEAFQDTVARLGGNASSAHTSGQLARAMLDDARERTAGALGVPDDAVVFTSGGTEANNLALFGCVAAQQRRAGAPSGRGSSLIVTACEHSSILAPAAELARRGHEVITIPVDERGAIELSEVERALQSGQSALLSVMAANNEVGMLTPLHRIGALVRALPASSRPVFHTDAIQALGRIPLDLEGWGVDLASLSAHKVGGPLGCGVLVRRAGTPLDGVIHGGGQESEQRSGTENVPAIVATSVAIERAVDEQQGYAQRTRALTTFMWEELHAALPGACLLGPEIDSAERLPNTLALAVPDIDGRVLIARLDMAGLEVSAGSACASGSLEPSHVLLAMGLSRERARSALRLSVGRTTELPDVERAVEILGRIFSERA